MTDLEKIVMEINKACDDLKKALAQMPEIIEKYLESNPKPPEGPKPDL